MAIRFAVANGNWSNTATWNGGTLPASNDDVFSNNFTVTINQDITAISLRNTSNVSPAITQGGKFVVDGNTGTRNVTLTGTRQSVSFTDSGLWQATSAATLFEVTATSGLTLNLISPAGSPNTNIGFLVSIVGNCTINYSGIMNQNPGFFSQFNVAVGASNGTLTIVGNPIGNGSSPARIFAPGYTVNIIGNLTNDILEIRAAATVNVTGNATAGSAVPITWNGGSGGVVTVTGNVTAASAAGINNNTTNQTIIVNGNVTASSATNGIIGNAIGTLVTVNGNLINVSDYAAVLALRLRISPSTSQIWTSQTVSGNRQLLTTNAFTNYPIVNDVRFGVTYSNLGSLTGSARIPDPASVTFGVPTGPTATGTAVLTRAQLLADFGALIAAYNG
jgi:hypothetical protein